ncbi:MAG: metal ABC transporter substrate-binding protein, partial [Candidatus Nanopelagicales bacterium]
MRPPRLALIPALALAFAAPFTACSSEEAATEPEPAEVVTEETTEAQSTTDSTPVQVVATTTMLGDVTNRIITCANPESTVTTLMPIGADPHDFSPSSAQVAQMVSAQVVIANGLELEAGLDDALENAASDGATVIEVVEFVDPIPFGAGGHSHDDEHADEDNEHGSEDPHFWFDMNRMATVALLIGDELATVNGPAYAQCGAQVADEIRAAETEATALGAASDAAASDALSRAERAEAALAAAEARAAEAEREAESLAAKVDVADENAQTRLAGVMAELDAARQEAAKLAGAVAEAREEAARELDDAILMLRHNHLDIGLWLLKTRGAIEASLATDAFLREHAQHWFVRETIGMLRRTLAR